MTVTERIADLQGREADALSCLDRATNVFRKTLHLSRADAMSKAITMNPGAYERATEYGREWRQLARRSGRDFGWGGQG